jgi:hypothetical protein
MATSGPISGDHGVCSFALSLSMLQRAKRPLRLLAGKPDVLPDNFRSWFNLDVRVCGGGDAKELKPLDYYTH